MIRTRHAVPALALVFALAACASKRDVTARYSPEEVPAVLDSARAALAEDGDVEGALDDLRSARITPGLEPDLRQEVQREVERLAERRIEELTRPKKLKELMDYGLPRRISVEAGLRGARLYYEEGERMKAFRLVREVDRKFPQHHRRGEAGILLGDVGFDLAADRGRYGLFFRYRSLAIQVLEYMVVEYPGDPRGDQALYELADIYEERKRLDLAIEKHQDMLLWFPESPLAVESQAHVPRLRLARLQSPEHDRSALLVAREELDAWLAEYGDHPRAGEVADQRLDCLRRLADNDLIVARFYRRVKNPTGAEYHARRALEEARAGGDPDQVVEAEELLRKVAFAEEET